VADGLGALPRCVICDGTAFAAGHGGRLAYTGALPACTTCKSVERHRIIRTLYDALKPLTVRLRALQFAPDISIQPTQFKSFTGSTYNGENSLDMMKTGLEAGSYDLIISNHVLEHVRDHHAALRESIRVVGAQGLVHLCVPSPMFVAKTRDWGFADPTKTYHYRAYGADAGIVFLDAMPGLHAICVVGRDTVTDTYEMVYWLSLSADMLLQMTTLLQRAHFVVVAIR
jgi:hypothetical protein